MSAATPLSSLPHAHRRRRRFGTASIITSLAALTLVGAHPAGASPPAAAAVTAATAQVDLGRVVGHTTPYSMGVDSSTYGANPLSSSVENTNEKALDARLIRIPVGYRNGKVTSSAAGSGYLDVPSLVARYRSWGFRVLAVIGGRTNDFDVAPGDATHIIQALGDVGVSYTGPNEPNNAGHSVADSAAVAAMIVREGRALYPTFNLWGPVWSYYNRSDLNAYIGALGSSLAGVDYHHYGMGTTWSSTDTVLGSTPTWGTEVTAERADLTAAGRNPFVAVDEVNLSWRYQDGTPASEGGDGNGNNLRFFTAVNTVFIASVCGHVLLAGGKCLPYALQNGPLGMLVEAGNTNPDQRPASSPMPAYWGIGAWTGAGLFPHMNKTFHAASGSAANVEVYAVDNVAHGENIVLINKSRSVTTTESVTLARATAGGYAVFQTNPASPYAAPVRIASGSYTSKVAVSLPPMSATTVVLSPA